MMCQEITMVDITNRPIYAKSKNLTLVLEFLRQSECAKSSIAIGKGYIQDMVDDTILYEYDADSLKVFHSKVDPDCQIIGTDALLEIYKDRILTVIYGQVPNVEFIKLLDKVYRSSNSHLPIKFSNTIKVVCDAIVDNRIDFVKLSTAVNFFLSHMTRESYYG